ncbi:MAG: 30S ribosomal protein S6 [Nitrospirae bacterium GWB2_47_37]|nr:MAG: 30S ribosomal protein S6 [Nitrospirae bacterium GWA2_46_11]OGW24339.1 MAG: 30S ribosomal protein S6 [Nitrospirae bacterium GWB2_47_37]
MNIYENVVILNPSLSEDELKSASDKISDLIKNAGGDIIKIDNWGKKKLAYELNKQKIGVYMLFLFKAPAPAIKKIEGYFKVFDPVIKFMVIKLEKKQIEALPKEAAGTPASQEVKAAE